MAPATSLFPLAQKFPAGNFFFQEEWNETLCSVTARFQRGRLRVLVTGNTCQQTLRDVPSVTRTGTDDRPTEMPGDPVWDTQTQAQA